VPSKHHHGHDVGERLYVHGHSLIHGLPAHLKLISMIIFLFAVVATPPEQFWAFGVYALILIVLIRLSGVRFRTIAPRMLIEVPFVIFAILTPFFGPEPRVEFLGLSLSQAGLIAGWSIIAKATIGVVCSILLAATTPARDLLLGLDRLRVPPLLVQIASFMLRYIHVVADEMHRMKLAREARGFEATGIKSWPAIAQSGGALFIRSYERGERVHLAMLSRGYTGRLPQLDDVVTTRQEWMTAMVLPTIGICVAALAWWVQR
jgi:cobalt/nickel transport system permease protein